MSVYGICAFSLRLSYHNSLVSWQYCFTGVRVLCRTYAIYDSFIGMTVYYRFYDHIFSELWQFSVGLSAIYMTGLYMPVSVGGMLVSCRRHSTFVPEVWQLYGGSMAGLRQRSDNCVLKIMEFGVCCMMLFLFSFFASVVYQS